MLVFFLINNNYVDINGLCGRAINSENKWLKDRNATLDIENALKNKNYDLIFIQLGTNDCKK
jgi:hypothetical protein